MKKQSVRGQGKAGFTLIELLVVIAIIAILASILMPALSSARQRAKDSQCVSNLKNLTQAVQSYTDNNNDLFPIWYGHWESHWCYMLQQAKYFSTTQKPADNYKALAYDVSAKLPRGVLQCPAAPEIDVNSAIKYSGTHFALNEYTYLDARNATNFGEALKRGKAPGRQPSEHLMIMDNNRENASSTDSKPSQWYVNNATFRYVEGTAVTTTGQAPVTGALRHRGGSAANVSFWDGHVEKVDPSAGKHNTKYYYANSGTRFFNPTK